MNKIKILNVIICCSLSIPSYAQEIPIADKATVSQLLRENKLLVQAIVDQKMVLEGGAHMFSQPDQYGRLTDILNSYQDFIDQKGDLPEDKRRALDQIVDASAEVGHIRERRMPGEDGVVNDASIQEALDQNQQLLDDQAALLQEKNKQVNDFRNQLANIKGQLASNNQRYSKHERATPKTIIKQVPVKEIVYKDTPALTRELAQKSRELDDIKQNLAGFKEQLAQNNRRYLDAVKESKSTMRNAKFDQANNQKLLDQNRRLQEDLEALKEEAQEASLAKAMAQKNLINDKSKQLESYKQELADLKEQLADTNNRLSLAEAETEKTKNEQVQQALAQKNLKNDELERYQQEITSLRNQLENANKRADQATRDVASRKLIDAQLDQAQVDRLKKSIEVKAAEINALIDQNNKLAGTVNALQEVIAKKENDPDPKKLQQEIAEKEGLLKSREALLEEKSAQSDRFKDELVRMKDELSKTNGRYEAAIKEYQDKIRNAKLDQTEAERLARDLADKTAENTNLASKNQSLEDTLKALNTNKNQLADLEKQLIDKDGQIALLKSELVRVLEQNTLMHQQLNQEDKDLQEIRDKAELFRKKYLEQLGMVEDKEKNIKHLNDRMTSLPKSGSNNEMDSLKEQLAKAEAEAQDLRSELKKTIQGNSQEKDKLNSEAIKLQIEKMAKASLTPQEQAQFDNLKKQYEIVVKNPIKNGKEAEADIEELKRHYEIVVKSPQEIAQMIKENREPQEPSQQQILALRNEAKELRDQLMKLKKEQAQKPMLVGKSDEQQQKPHITEKFDETELVALRNEAKELRSLLTKLQDEQPQKNNDAVNIKEVQRKLKITEKEGEELKGLIASAQAQAQSFRDDLNKTTQELAAKKEELKSKNQYVADLESKFVGLSKAVAGKKDADAISIQLKQAQDQVVGLQAQLKQDDAAFVHIRDKGLELKEKITSLNNTVSLKEAQIADLRLRLRSIASAPAPNAQAGIDNLPVFDKGLSDQIRQKLGLAEKDAQELRQQVAKLQEVSVARADNGKYDSLEKQLDLAKSETAVLKTQIARLREVQSNSVDKSRFDELRKQYDRVLKTPVKEVVRVLPAVKVVTKEVIVKSDTKELEQRLGEAQKEASDYKDQMEKLRTENDKENAAHQEKFRDLKTQLDASQGQFAALKEEILKNRDIITAKQEQTLTIQNSLNEQFGKLANKTTELKQKDERMTLQEMLQVKQRQHIDLLMRKNQLIADYQNSLVGKLNMYQQKFNGASKDWGTHQQGYESKLAEFKVSIDTMNQNNKELNAAIQAVKKEKDEAYELMDRFKARLKETSDVNEDQSKELQAYKQRAEELEINFRRLQEDVSSKESLFDETKEQLDQIKAEHQKALQQVQVKDLSLSIAQSSMQAKTKILQTLVDQLKDQIKISDSQLALTRQQLKEAEIKISQANRYEDLERLKAMLKSSREEIITINNVLKNKEQQINALQKELQDNSIDFTAQRKAIEALKADMEKQQQSITKLNEDIVWKSKENARLKEQLKNKKLDLLPASLQGVELVIAKDRKQIADLTAQLEIANNKIKAASNPKAIDPQGLRQALADAKEQIATLKDKLNQKLQGLVNNDPAVMGMNKEIELLRQSLVQVMKENGDLKDKNEVMFYQIQDMQADIASCQAQISAMPSQSQNK